MAAVGCSWSWGAYRRSLKRPLRTVVSVRVIIIAGGRIKIHARVNEGYIIVLRGAGHRCDSVMVMD